MKMKKLVSGAMATVMALGLTVPAFASTTTPAAVKVLPETTESSFAVELEGMIYTPTVRVSVTDTGSVYVNPSKSAVAGTLIKALDGTTNLDYNFAGQTLVSTPILIRSDTDKALKVSATATATVPTSSGVKLADAKATSADDGKVVTLQMAGSSSLGNSSALTSGLEFSSVTAATKGKLAAETGGKSAKLETAAEIATIDAATVNVDPTTKKATTAVPQYGVVLVTGTSNEKVTNWTENDVVNVSVALTFAVSSD